MPQDLREFRDLDEAVVSAPGFERIDPNGCVGIGGFNDNDAVIKISLDNFFLVGNGAEQEGRRIAVQIKKHETTGSLYILF